VQWVPLFHLHSLAVTVLLLRFAKQMHKRLAKRCGHNRAPESKAVSTLQQCQGYALSSAMIRSNAQVFGFSVRKSPSMYRQWDWDQLTTVAWNTDPELICLAHQRGAKDVVSAELPANRTLLESASYRAEWVCMYGGLSAHCALKSMQCL